MREGGQPKQALSEITAQLRRDGAENDSLVLPAGHHIDPRATISIRTIEETAVVSSSMFHMPRSDIVSLAVSFLVGVLIVLSALLMSLSPDDPACRWYLVVLGVTGLACGWAIPSKPWLPYVGTYAGLLTAVLVACLFEPGDSGWLGFIFVLWSLSLIAWTLPALIGGYTGWLLRKIFR
jgi:hypothetical protein